MIPTSYERLRELHEKMLDWICEHIKEDEDLFRALYGRIGFAQSELDPEIECRIYKLYNALPPKEKLELRVKAEYGFDSVDSYAAMHRLRTGILCKIRETATKKNIKKIHMVLAASSDFTFFLAQGFSKNHDPEVVVYHYDRNSDTRYPWGISNILSPENAVIRQTINHPNK